MAKKPENFFDVATDTVNSLEDSLVNLVSVIVPWLVPLIPAYLTYVHVTDPKHLNFDPFWGWIAGAVVEGLGLSTMNTYFRFDRHNRKYKDEKNKMPLWVPIVSYIWYLVIVLLVNVVFDWVSGVSWSNILAVALFSTLSLPAGALITVRTLYVEWVSERSRARSRSTGEPNVEQDGASGEQGGADEANQPNSNRETEQLEYPSQYAEQIESILERTWQVRRQIPSPAMIVRALNTPTEQGGFGAHLDPRKSSGYISTLTRNWRIANNVPEEPANSNGG